jgi:hypothetical protein
VAVVVVGTSVVGGSVVRGCVVDVGCEVGAPEIVGGAVTACRTVVLAAETSGSERWVA